MGREPHDYTGIEVGVEKEIGLVNDIIVEAIVHGSDKEDVYYRNLGRLIVTMIDYIEYKRLRDIYVVHPIDIRAYDGTVLFDVPQIVKRNDIIERLEDTRDE